MRVQPKVMQRVEMPEAVRRRFSQGVRRDMARHGLVAVVMGELGAQVQRLALTAGQVLLEGAGVPPGGVEYRGLMRRYAAEMRRGLLASHDQSLGIVLQSVCQRLERAKRVRRGRGGRRLKG